MTVRESQLDLGDVQLRPWQRGDRHPLVRHADDVEVSRYLANRFPSPYTLADADRWIDHCESLEDPIASLAIVVEGEACGGIGIERREDLECLTGDVGYWLGRALWGRGIVARALTALTEYAFVVRDFERLEAVVIADHTASVRVLEKAGYTLESRRRRALLKHATLHDGVVYVRLRGEDVGRDGRPG